MKRSLLFLFCTCLILLPAYSQDRSPEKDKTFDLFFLEGLRLKEKEQHNDAFNAFRFALGIDSTSSAALYELSHYYLYLGKPQDALDALGKAIEYNPDNTDYKMALANLSREAGQYETAIKLYESLTKDYPDRPEIHFYLSEMYLRLQQVDKAIESLDNLENNLGVNEMISLQKYQLYLITQDNANALKEIEKLSDKFPTEARYIILIGDYYLGMGNNEKALAYYQKAYNTDPDNPYYFISMANYYERIGDEEMVYKEIENALKNPNIDINIKLDVLSKYFQIIQKDKKDKGLILSLIETLIDQHPQQKELNMIYGEYLLSLNKPEEARFQFQLVTEAQPDNKAAWTQLLAIAVRKNDMDETLKIASDALLHFPQAPEFYFYKGMAYYTKEKYQEALDTFLEAVEVVPDEERKIRSDFYGQIGDLYHQLGDMEKTYEAYDKALEYNKNNVLVLNNYAYFLSLDKKDLDKAERMSAQTVQLEPNNPTYIDTYAWVFFQKGNYSLAKFYIESALSKTQAGVSSDIIEHYGDILYKDGNEEKAVEEWNKALVLKQQEGEDITLLEKKIKDKMYYEE